MTLSVGYNSAELLTCACGGDVLVCVSNSLTASGAGYIEGTLLFTGDHIDACHTCWYHYQISYEEDQLASPSVPLLVTDILGIVCKGCFASYVDFNTPVKRPAGVELYDVVLPDVSDPDIGSFLVVDSIDSVEKIIYLAWHPPIVEITDASTWSPVFSCPGGTMTFTPVVNFLKYASYSIVGKRLFFDVQAYTATLGGIAETVIRMTLPFDVVANSGSGVFVFRDGAGFYGVAGAWVAGSSGGVGHIDLTMADHTVPFTLGANFGFNGIQGFVELA